MIRPLCLIEDTSVYPSQTGDIHVAGHVIEFMIFCRYKGYKLLIFQKMNQSQEQHLEEIFRKNKNNGIAIAIIGCWGVGKTFAWNKFLETRAKEEEKIKHLPAFKRNNDQKVFSKKYAYISLFGIENLSDLKVAISTNMSSNYFNQESSKNFEIPAFIKKGLTALREVKLTSSEYGVSSSARIFESMLYAQVKDAIICFDDFERLSNKLDIKDVMGLANQLKLERNCQVVLILDESKSEGDNQKKYAEYKEKLIDETIKITSVEPLIRANTKDIDDDLVNLMVKFAKDLEIHNFRFFQKVIKLYRLFSKQLSEEIAYSTKEIILIRVLQGYFIEDYGQSKSISWYDFSLDNAVEKLDKDKKTDENKNDILDKLKNISYLLISASDEWSLEFKKWFDQKGDPNFEKLNDLANSDLISEESNKLCDDLNLLMEKWRNLEIHPSFCNDLYSIASKRIAFENLKNLSFYCDLLNEFGEPHLASELQKSIEEYLLNEYQSKGYLFANDHFIFGFKPENRFHRYLKSLQEQRPKQGFPILIDVIHGYIFNNGFNPATDSFVLTNATKADWHKLIFMDITNDERFKKSNKFQIL
jgi:hypothetical protein